MSHSSIHQLSTFEDEFSEPSTSPKPFMVSSYELDPNIVDMVQGCTFSSLGIEDPYHHLLEFEELCSYLVIPGMSQENLSGSCSPFLLWKRRNNGTLTTWGMRMVIGKSSEMTFVSRSLPYPMKHLDEVTSLHLKN